MRRPRRCRPPSSAPGLARSNRFEAEVALDFGQDGSFRFVHEGGVGPTGGDEAYVGEGSFEVLNPSLIWVTGPYLAPAGIQPEDIIGVPLTDAHLTPGCTLTFAAYSSALFGSQYLAAFVLERSED